MKVFIIKKNPLTIPVVLSEVLGLYKENKINVSINYEEDFLFKGKNPYATSESDCMMGDLTFFFYALEKGIDSVITSNLTRTIHLLLRKDKSFKDENLKIGVNRTGLFRLFMENDLKDKLKNPEIVWINNTYERIEALKKNEIDGLIAIEPFIDEIENRDLGKRVWSLKNSDKNLVMWCFKREYYEKNKEEVKIFHKVLREANNIYNNMLEEEKRKFLKEHMNYDEEHIEIALKFKFEKEGQVREEDYNLCQDWMIKTGEIKNKYRNAYYNKSSEIL